MRMTPMIAGLLLPSLVALVAVTSPGPVLALYDTEYLSTYTDAPSVRSEQIAISALTELGIVRGNPDGTFKPNITINRAEFMKIVMALLPETTEQISHRCFPDVDPDVWFAPSVCRAKSLGIISGSPVADTDSSQWPFDPTRSVKYEEALKVLARLYGVPLVDIAGGEWYETYLKSAQQIGIDLRDSAPGSALTRGQMARLVVAFLAYARGELEDLRTAQDHPPVPVRTVFGTSSSVSFDSSDSSNSSDSSFVYDTFPEDATTDDSVLVLGRVTHILGAAELFSNSEPIRADAFIIDLLTANTSLDAMNVYDDRGRLIGRATIDASVSARTRYRLNVKAMDIVLPYRDEYSFYVRGVLKSQESGGTSGGSLQISRMGVTGIGVWSTRGYEQFTDGDTFVATTVARSAITTVANAGDGRSILVSGSDLEIGAFYFAGATGHTAARLQITKINFQIGTVGAVILSDATIRVDGGSDRSPCSVAGTVLTCDNLAASFGRLDDGPRTLRVYATVSIEEDQGSAGLQLSINDPGSISTPGDITWTDGVTTFTYIDIGKKPLARGTYYSY